MKLTIKGDPKEIAALVWELQERREATFCKEALPTILTGEAVHLSGEKVGRSFLTAE